MRFIEVLQGQQKSWRGPRIAIGDPASVATADASPPLQLDNLPVRRRQDPSPVSRVVARVGRERLPIGLRRFVLLFGHVCIIGRRDEQLFPFAGMLAQLKRLGEIFSCPPQLSQRGLNGTYPRVSLFRFRRHLLRAERLAALAVNHLQPITYSLPRLSIPSDIRLAVRAQAKLARNFRRQHGTGGTHHQLQCLCDLVIREHVQEGGLGQGHRQRRFQRVVKDRIAGTVFEVGDNDCVLLRESLILFPSGSKGRRR